MHVRNSLGYRLFVSVLLGAGVAWAQPSAEPTRPVVTPGVTAPVTGESPNWDEGGRHVRIVAEYDGRRVKVLSAVSGQGRARSYLSQRSDIVVVILDRAGSVLKEFNLPDPRERRVWEQPPARPMGVDGPRILLPVEGTLSLEQPRGRSPTAQSSEKTIREPRAQFELFIPRLDAAKSVEFRAGEDRKRLLGQVDLARVP